MKGSSLFPGGPAGRAPVRPARPSPFRSGEGAGPECHPVEARRGARKPEPAPPGPGPSKAPGEPGGRPAAWIK